QLASEPRYMNDYSEATMSVRKPLRQKRHSIRFVRANRGSRYTCQPLESRRLLSITTPGIPLWLEEGPAPEQNGQVLGMGGQNNPTDGAVEALAPHPTDPNTLFAATVAGGVWRTTNALASSPTWFPLTDQFSSTACGAIAFDPLDSTHNTLW